MPNRSHILVVEDELHLAEGIKYNLEAEGYRVTNVGDGPSALRVLDDSENVVDLIVLDLMLPEMSGYKVCEWLRERGMDAERHGTGVGDRLLASVDEPREERLEVRPVDRVEEVHREVDRPERQALVGRLEADRLQDEAHHRLAAGGRDRHQGGKRNRAQQSGRDRHGPEP